MLRIGKNRISDFLVFATALVLLASTLAQTPWQGDECVYMITGQEFVRFLLSQNASALSLHVLRYLHPPSDEAIGLVNHPFLAKLIIGAFLALGATGVPIDPSSVDCAVWLPTPTQMFWARIPTTIVAAGAVSAIYAFLHRRFGADVAALGSLFVLSDLAFLGYSRMAMLDAYAASFLIVAFMHGQSLGLLPREFLLLPAISLVSLQCFFGAG